MMVVVLLIVVSVVIVMIVVLIVVLCSIPYGSHSLVFLAIGSISFVSQTPHDRLVNRQITSFGQAVPLRPIANRRQNAIQQELVFDFFRFVPAMRQQLTQSIEIVWKSTIVIIKIRCGL